MSYAVNQRFDCANQILGTVYRLSLNFLRVLFSMNRETVPENEHIWVKKVSFVPKIFGIYC